MVTMVRGETLQTSSQEPGAAPGIYIYTYRDFVLVVWLRVVSIHLPMHCIIVEMVRV